MLIELGIGFLAGGVGTLIGFAFAKREFYKDLQWHAANHFPISADGKCYFFVTEEDYKAFQLQRMLGRFSAEPKNVNRQPGT